MNRASASAIEGTGRGVVATAAMTAFLVLAQRCGLLGKQPPRIIVETLMPGLPQHRARRVAAAAHFGYGAAGGAAFRLLTRWVPRNAATGTAFGLAVWAASYEGWLSALGILPPAHRDRPPRAATMLIAHVIYGAALGLKGR